MSVTDFTPFFPFHASLPTHRKTYALARILSKKRVEVVGMISFLLSWVVTHSNGEVPSDPIFLAEAMQLEGDPAILQRALIQIGWLDPCDDKTKLRVHDWDDYAGELLLRRATRLEQNRTAQLRRRQKLERISTLPPSTANSSDIVTVPNVSMTSALCQHDISIMSSHNRTEQKRTEYLVPVPLQKNIFTTFEQLTARTCTPAEYQKLDELEKEHGYEHTLAAIAEARDNNARSIRYLETVLENWRAKGYEKTKTKKGGNQNGGNTGKNKSVRTGVRKLTERASYTSPEEFRADGGGSRIV